MRVTSAFFVSALIRRCGTENIPAVVVRRGAEDAGAIAIIIDRLDGSSDLYLPAPQAAFGEGSGERLFERILERALPDAIRERLERERRFDPDLWVVEIEDREGRTMFGVTKPE
jgi:hypothetical protein